MTESRQHLPQIQTRPQEYSVLCNPHLNGDYIIEPLPRGRRPRMHRSQTR